MICRDSQRLTVWQRRWFHIAREEPDETEGGAAPTLVLRWYSCEEDVVAGVPPKKQFYLRDMDPDYGLKLAYSSERIDGVKTLVRKHTMAAMAAMAAMVGDEGSDSGDEDDEDAGASRARLVILLGDQHELKLKAVGGDFPSAHSVEDWYRAIFFSSIVARSGRLEELLVAEEAQRIEDEKTWLDVRFSLLLLRE